MSRHSSGRGRGSGVTPGSRPRVALAVAAALGLAGLTGCGSGENAVATGSGSASGGSVSAPATTEPAGSADQVGRTGVRGRVTRPSGEPVELATVSVSPPPSGDGPVRQSANVTDAKGIFFMPLPPGEWEITVDDHTHPPITFSVAVEDSPVVEHDVVIPPG